MVERYWNQTPALEVTYELVLMLNGIDTAIGKLLHSRCEGGLRNLHEVISAFHLANLDQRIIGVRPEFYRVERVMGLLVHVEHGHDLHEQPSFRKLAAFDAAEQLALVAFAVPGDNRFGLAVGVMLVPLINSWE